MGSILCEHCPAACCRYLALPIDQPTNARDYDDLRWYLMHEAISVFVEEGDWYIQIQTRCENLGQDNLCTVYESRPQICSEYEPGACDYAGTAYEYDHLFTHPKQIAAFYETRTGKKLAPGDRGSSRKKPKPGRKNSAQHGLVQLQT